MMGATILYAPVKHGKELEVNAPSSFLAIMERACLELPVELTERSIPTLEGMKAACENEEHALIELIGAIRTHKRLRLWAEW